VGVLVCKSSEPLEMSVSFLSLRASGVRQQPVAFRVSSSVVRAAVYRVTVCRAFEAPDETLEKEIWVTQKLVKNSGRQKLGNTYLLFINKERKNAPTLSSLCKVEYTVMTFFSLYFYN
jgi:hypothetical protein